MHEVLKKITSRYSRHLYRDVNTNEDVKENYFVWNYADDRGGLFADDEPTTDEISIQLHWYVSQNHDFESAKKKIRKELMKNGYTYPTVTLLYENDTKLRHIIFETEISVEREE